MITIESNVSTSTSTSTPKAVPATRRESARVIGPYGQLLSRDEVAEMFDPGRRDSFYGAQAL